MPRHPLRTTPWCHRGTPVSVRLALGLVTLALLLSLPGSATAHSALQRSSPAAGDTLQVAPRELRLTFSRTVELALASLRLVGPDGAEVALAPLAVDQQSDRVLVGGIRGPLRAGGYMVHWQIVSEDGHPVRGEFAFDVAPGAQGLATEVAAPAPSQPDPQAAASAPAPGPAPAPFGADSPLYAAVRWLTFVGLLGAIGAVAFRVPVLFLVRRHGDEAGRQVVAPAARRAASAGLGAVVLLLVALVLRLVAQSFAVYGEGPLGASGVGTLLTRTMWGWGWLLQAAGALLALVGFALARRGSRPGWGAAAVGTVVLGFSPALSGHAAATPGVPALAMISDALHVLGAGGWLGSLLAVVAVGLPVALRLPAPERGAAVRALINAFSPAALAFAGVVVVTGLFASWLHLQSLSALWESAYGRTLLLKLALLSVVFGTGAYNWLRVRPALGGEAAAHRLRRSASLELAAGALVLAVTAVLVATPPPEEPTDGPQQVAEAADRQ